MDKLIKIRIYKLFIASSMQNSCRELVCDIIKKVNTKLELHDIKFDLIEYGETPIVDHGPDTQQILNEKAATSDLLIVLAENNIPIGKYTYGEYQAAYKQSLNNPDNHPYIKVFSLCNQSNEHIKLAYIAEDGTCRNFETKLYDDSKRYPQYILRTKFNEFFEEWLTKIALYGFEHNLTQDELAYGDHLHKIGQGGIRQNNKKYYKRDNLDGQIENIFKTSPIVILEGNTYSGKTRAAFEFMKSCKEWNEYDFHIYDNRNFIKDLNEIYNIDYSGANRGNVFFFDDINDILNKEDEKIDRNQPLWSKLNGYNELNGFNIKDFGKTRIIFTISGKLSTSQKNKIYEQIFNNPSADLHSSLKKIIVNFDVYDQYSFRQMVNAMQREGMIDRASISPGNYTIGSLFIRTEEIRKEAMEQYEQNSALMIALVGHFKYTSTKSRFTGLIEEIQELYDFIRSTKSYAHTYSEKLEDGIEGLRQKGLLVTSTNEYDTLRKIYIDKYILDIFNEVVSNKIKYEKTKGIYALNKLLIDYAMECQREERRSLASHHICYVTQMAYLIVDRNQPADEEIIDLIEMLASTLLSVNRKRNKENANAVIIMNLVDIASIPGRYSMNFASSAIAKINDFEMVNDLLDTCYDYYQYCMENNKDNSNIIIDFYKRAVYSMLSTGNRIMTMEQERRILDRIFDNGEEWKFPFEDSDLQNVFNLARLSKYTKKMDAQQIIELLPNATLKGLKLLDDNEEPETNNSKKQADKYKYFVDIVSSSSIEDENSDEEEQSGLYENIFLKQLDNTAINAIRRIRSFDEFIKVIESLRAMCIKSIHVKLATERTFTRDFYKIVPEIVRTMNYIDRNEFFKFILCIDDNKGMLGNGSIKSEYVELHRASRIHLLNQILIYLDENAALEGYEEMVDNKLCDMETLSHLLKNEFLNFEQLVRLIGKDDGQTNFITLNQLLGKAETLSDANVCLRLMGIMSCDPCKIRDESALVKYLQIKYIGQHQCIEIIKGRRQLYPDALSDTTITAVLSKLNLEQLIDIFFPSEKNIGQGYYFEHYGFLDKEIERMRKNAIHLNMLFSGANNGGNEVAQLISAKFEEIIQDPKLQLLITDPDCNGKNGILSVYMKNRHLFPDYESVRRFYDNLSNECKPEMVDHYIYSVFLWNIIDAYKRNIYDRTKAIKLLNSELISAYAIFAKLYTKDKVIYMMANLYRYRPLLTDEFSFNNVEEYAYENRILKTSYVDYLEYLIKNNTAFVDGTFIYNALIMMQKQINDEVYDKLAILASLNHVGVKYDTILRTNKNSPVLSQKMQQRLFNYDVESNTLYIDKDLVHNVSYIKVLCFLLYNELMTLDNAEKYRMQNKIPITETYLNLALKCMSQNIIKSWRLSGHDNDVLKNGYDQMWEYINNIFPETSYIHKSVQMCLSLIAVTPNEESLNHIFLDNEFAELKNKTEVIAARMKETLRLRHNSSKADLTLSEFKDLIVENCRNVNIWIINIYLSTFVKIAKHELTYVDNSNIGDTPFDRCWPLLKEKSKIDVFELLKLDEKTKIDIIEQMELQENKWLIEANVQTFSYFVQTTPNLISTMDTLFNGDFTYDDSGKKNCLKDALKNYAFTYETVKLKDKDCARKEVEHICQILLRDNNRRIFEEICDEYIIRSTHKIKSNKWKRMNALWEDLLTWQDFRIAMVHYICKSEVKMSYNKGRRSSKLLYLDRGDFMRVQILKTALCMDNFDDELKHKVVDCYNKVIFAAEKTGDEFKYKDAELIKSIFSLNEC